MEHPAFVSGNRHLPQRLKPPPVCSLYGFAEAGLRHEPHISRFRAKYNLLKLRSYSSSSTTVSLCADAMTFSAAAGGITS